jgi:DNA-directed RNA polymerase specialized sigma24 family protein
MRFETDVLPTQQQCDPALLNQLQGDDCPRPVAATALVETDTPRRAKPRRPSTDRALLELCNKRLRALGRAERVERVPSRLRSKLGEFSLVVREKVWERKAWTTTTLRPQLDLQLFADEISQLPAPAKLPPKAPRWYEPATRPEPKAKVESSTLPLKDQIAAQLSKVRSRVNIVIHMNGYFAVDAEAIAQDVLAWGIENSDKYDPTRGTLLTWMYRRIESATKNAIRANYRRPQTGGDSALVGSIATAPSPSAMDFENAVESLTPNKRDAYKVVRIGRSTIADAARDFDVPIGTLSSWVQRAEQDLQEYFADNCPEMPEKERDDAVAGIVWSIEPTAHETLVEIASADFEDSAQECATRDFNPSVRGISDYNPELDTNDVFSPKD